MVYGIGAAIWIQSRCDDPQSYLYVNGVGAGSAVCRTLGRFHIACNYLHRGDEDAGPPAAGPPAPQRDLYVANIAEGSGEDLPAILGLKSMQNKDAIIVLKKGSEKMIFPYDGKFRIQLPPKSEVIKMKKTPSQHLAITCGDFEGAVDDNNVEAFTIAHNWDDAGPPAAAAPAAEQAFSLTNVTAHNMGDWIQNISTGIMGTILEQKYDMLQDIFRAVPDEHMLDEQRGAILRALRDSFFASLEDAARDWQPTRGVAPEQPVLHAGPPADAAAGGPQ